jgi:catechol 2,3-dioxygenase-like lactoylglutathione lyase family enzyme
MEVLYMKSAAYLLIFALFPVFSAIAFAQLTPLNDKGVTMGHIHWLVKDSEAHKKLWVDIFGAQVAHAGALELIKLPGIIILLSKPQAAEPAGEPTADHCAFLVRDLETIKKKLAAANIAVSSASIATFPDGVRVELIEDAGLAVPVAFHHFHLFSGDMGISSWYMEHFGVAFPAGPNFPGGEMRFGVQANPPRVPSKDHVFDHIGFEVKNLKEFLDKLKSAGIKIDLGPIEAPAIGLKVAFITDPIGTRIELTEGLAGK